jgi:glycosyltransferase involved in cell wall biosynthesis
MAHFLQSQLSYSFRSASHIVVLDRFMRARIIGKGVRKDHIAVIPPWSHGEAAPADETGRDRFRKQHSLDGRFVVMYSGNHSPCHPLDTLLEAAKALSAHSKIVFCFIGGGSEFRKVKEFAARYELRNIVCLPYQPLEQLSDSLSSADLHSVIMGEKFVGIIHPCKIYNILAQGSPFLYIGPSPSHIRDLIGADGLQDFSYCAHHGDVSAVIQSILSAIAKADRRVPALMDTSARFSSDVLASRMARLLEAVAAGSGRVTVQVSEDIPEISQ